MPSSLRSLPSDQLLAQLSDLVARDTALEVDLLVHLGEVDARRLYLREGFPSMYAYCVGALRFAESVAYKRIAAARAARRHPQLLDALRSRDLHMTAVSLIAPHLTRDGAGGLIEAARHQTSEGVRRMLADRHPKPDVAASIRRVPHKAGAPAPAFPQPELASAAEGRSETAAQETVEREPSDGGETGAPSPLPAAARSREPRVAVEPLGEQRYFVRFTADRELHDQLQELRALMRHQVPDGDLGAILARAVGMLLKLVRREKFGECPSPRPAKPAAETPSRAIPAAIRRVVAQRDGERCTFVSPGGRRCGARDFLEFHHCDPWARNAAHDIEGITLRCRAHNRYAAERDFGEEHMQKFRKTDASDPTPAGQGSACDASTAYRLDPDPVGRRKPVGGVG